MYHIQAMNVNQALCDGLWWLAVSGVKEESRNGPVIVSPCPVTTTYLNIRDRVLFAPIRNANPFFHLFEALWMLQGRNDLAFPMFFNSRFKEYSDDGLTLHGAYGYRWRYKFGYDQVAWLIDELKNNVTTRRAVLSMWYSGSECEPVDNDLNIAAQGGKDVPCNTHAYFDRRYDRLNMTVCCRSNDIWWGAYGANAVHFSMLLEYMAARVGCEPGVYRQISNNYHIYPEVLPWKEDLRTLAAHCDDNRYVDSPGSGTCFFTEDNVQEFDMDMVKFFTMCGAPDNVTRIGNIVYETKVFRTLIVPMFNAWLLWKKGKDRKISDIVDVLEEINPLFWDWKQASIEWMLRKTEKEDVR